ncbi:N-6 DNA methylase [bacterium]|nr:N-6 DNA methylase [bacterium]
MALKKSELYSTLWKSCDELRGGMDASQYKDYVLTLLFVKYVSDKYKDKKNALIKIPDGASFDDMVQLKGKPGIGEGIDIILGKLSKATYGKVNFSVSFNNDEHLGKGKDMVDRLSKLIGIFQNPALNFSNNRSEDDDILGDAYEYLMRHFATESGKSKGQFYTPSEVSRVLASVIDVESADKKSHTVYDPTCGSGSLLLKVADHSKKGLSIYGQENENATANLAIMNTWLHGQETALIEKGNTISDPKFKDPETGGLKRFDFVVANPPFSNKNWSNGLIDDQSKQVKDPFRRFDGFEVPPMKNGDYVFLLHIAKSLNEKGKGAVILPHGVLFRGNTEAKIREELIRRGWIKGIIGLPANLFYGTGIPACIIVLDKEHAKSRKGIFMVDASKGYIKDGNKNRLREQDIHRMVDVFTKQIEVPKYARLVSFEEIEQNEFNLNIPRYIDTREEEDIQDLDAHLNGGLPARDIDGLSKYWEAFPSIKNTLFQASNRAGYYDLKVENSDINETISNHPEFQQFITDGLEVFDQWTDKHMDFFRGITEETRPKEFIHKISEALLESYRFSHLIDEYDMYQHLMDYWNETMKDDVYMVIEGGWKIDLVPATNAKGKIIKGEFESELVPKEFIINRYFSERMEELEGLESELSTTTGEMESMLEEHGGDEGLLNEVQNDKGNITKGDLNARIRELQNEGEEDEELELLIQYKSHQENEAQIKKQIKELEQELDQRIIEQYKKLNSEEIMQLVIEDKWIGAVKEEIEAELNEVNQRLTSRVKELAERYDKTLPDLEEKVSEYTEKVNEHLKEMGLVW